MNNPRLSWTPIETDISDDTEKNRLKMNIAEELSDEEQQEEDLEQQKKNSQDTRRGILTVSQNEKGKAEEDDKDESEETQDKDKGSLRKVKARSVNDSRGVEDDQEEESKKPEGRAHKRIKNLLGRLNQESTARNQIAQENAELKRQLAATQKQSFAAQKSNWGKILDNKEAELEAAVQSNDAKAVAKASKELADAQMRFNAYDAVEDEMEETKDEPQRQVTPIVPDAAKDWIKRNPWFQTDEKKHVIARMISRDLSTEGELDPNDDDYWVELDNRLGEYGVKPGKQKDSGEEEELPKTKKKGSPVGSRRDEDAEDFSDVDRQFTRKGNTITASPTQSDRDMAERMGIKVSDLMQEKYKYAKQGFKGYVNIDIPGQS